MKGVPAKWTWIETDRAQDILTRARRNRCYGIIEIHDARFREPPGFRGRTELRCTRGETGVPR